MRSTRSDQQGVMLLEALIGILIFSLGVLALVAMQAVSISNVSNARYRTEAAFLANEIISSMWVDRGAALANLDNYKYPGPAYAPKDNWVTAVTGLMPQSDIYPPSITVTPVPGLSAQQVTVTIRWRAPDALTPSNHVAIGYLSDP